MMFLSPKDVVQRYQTKKAERSNWESMWQEIADLFLPRKNTFMVKRSEGEDRNIQIYDNTGMQSLELFAAALHSYLTNPNGEWFEMTTGDLELDDRDDVRKFLQDTTRLLHSTFNNSNFQTEIHELFMDVGGVGTSPMAVEEDDEFDVRFSTKFLGDVVVCENHRGLIDELYLEFEWSARQIVAKYGEKAVTEKVLKAYKDNKDEKFKVIFCVYPREYDSSKKMGFPFIAQHILSAENHEMKKEGFHEFPYVVPRFSKAAGESYGRSPAMNALAEMKVLNVMTEVTLEGAQKVIDPPLQAPDDGFILQVNTYPGGITHYRAGSQDRIEAVFNDSRVDFGIDIIKNSQEKVRNAFYINQFQMGEGPSSLPRTATEISFKAEENFRFLGPMMGRMTNELLRPLINRSFGILYRKNKIKNIPQVLSGRKIDVKFSSFIARSQKMVEAQNVQKFIQACAPFFQMDPTSIQLIDAEAGIKKVLGRSYGVPQELFRDKEELAKLQEQMQAQQQAEQEQQKKLQDAEVMSKVAPTAALAMKPTV
jgi:hypothetical protein